MEVATIQLWVSGASYVGEPVWRVMRQDDNGNVCTMTSVTSRCEANKIVTAFEARGHEQTYWVEGSTSG